MNDFGPHISTTYCTLYRLGYWASLDAKVEFNGPDEIGLYTYNVYFVLIGKHGDGMDIGYAIITKTVDDKPEVFDENGETFPDVDAAIRHHAASLMQLTPMPGWRTAKPTRHETWAGEEATIETLL
jgi:hypothetical protein